ncbi:D-beta-hydroxybutyrate dehydrogenase, mitochondrial-like [Ruditapes philippinarum]|uniref:D-beta-hydroxybutyrate dehydrogenase, mitochondrial-like n=1 Tax=Ruditapes philippinarum TaxID=129788 RepID=UPI00295AA471|nr:D-beta-hydroxybutyrate dehydrogenase, mitochondrial-like [Ruditapes philippinarum]
MMSKFAFFCTGDTSYKTLGGYLNFFFLLFLAFKNKINMKLKTSIAFHSFELAYLVVLAILPFIAAIKIVATILVSFLLLCSLLALIKKLTKRCISMNGQTVVISGCDTGFGHALVKRLDYLGFTVVAGCLDNKGDGAEILRKWSDSGRIHVVQLDVTSDQSVASLHTYVQKLSPDGVWALVNNAGVNFVGDIEFSTMEQFKRVAEVNQFGVIRLTKAILPLVRKCKGRVINVTSAEGRICLPSYSVYGSTKYAVESFSDCLRLEMRKFGVGVIIIEPGDYAGTTGMLSAKSLHKLRKEMDTMWGNASEEVKSVYGKDYFDAVYAGTVEAAKNAAKTTGLVIDSLEDAVTNTHPRIRYLVDGSCKLIDVNNWLVRIRSVIPDSWLDFVLDFKYNRRLPPVAEKL